MSNILSTAISLEKERVGVLDLLGSRGLERSRVSIR